MTQSVAIASGFVAGLSLCSAIIVATILRFRRDADVKDLLISLAAAAVALVLGTLTQIIISFNIPAASHGQVVVSAGSAMLACLSTLLSAPVGMGWGWATRFVCGPATAIRQARGGAFMVRGMLLGLLAAGTVIPAFLIAALAKHGHNSTIELPGLAAAFSFLGAMLLVTALVLSKCWDESIVPVLRHIGTGAATAILLAFGVLAGTTGVVSLLQDVARRMEAWNILIFFYPVYVIALFAIAAALLFYAARTFARMQSGSPTI